MCSFTTNTGEKTPTEDLCQYLKIVAMQESSFVTQTSNMKLLLIDLAY